MRKNSKVIILCLMVTVFFSMTIRGQQLVPKKMNFQGMLKTLETGAPVADGNYSLTFSIYDSPTATTALWTETQNVEVNRGIFNVDLGSRNILNIPFDKYYWLGMKIGSDSEIMPRTPLTSSPYSFTTQNLALPFSGSFATPGGREFPALIDITQTGRGTAGRFSITNELYGGATFEVYNKGTGIAGKFVIDNTRSTGNFSPAIEAITNGRGSAGYFEIHRLINDRPAINAVTNGKGPALTAINNNSRGIPGATLKAINNSSGSGIAGVFDTKGTDATVVLGNTGSGPLLKGFGGNGGNDEFRFENNGTLVLFDESHNRSIRLSATTGRTTTRVLEITGGSDLSEGFEVNGTPGTSVESLQPGMVVSIDPDHPGKLVISCEAYDRKVAGIISGAGGIKTGMLMAQSESMAEGATPVALAGRVYCWVDASIVEIKPGDLLTTSSTPGHAMKVNDFSKAQGAIIGKAMTGLQKSKGLVLVLVSMQ